MAIPFSSAEIQEAIGNALREAVDDVAYEFARDVVPNTPVDTGHARRNWQVNIGAPNGQELPGVDKSGQGTVNNIKSRLRATNTRNPFLLVFVENNVPYANRLNQGWSKQAPALFVERSLNAAISAVNSKNRRKFI